MSTLFTLCNVEELEYYDYKVFQSLHRNSINLFNPVYRIFYSH